MTDFTKDNILLGVYKAVRPKGHTFIAVQVNPSNSIFAVHMHHKPGEDSRDYYLSKREFNKAVKKGALVKIDD
jgi:hypothetical protein